MKKQYSIEQFYQWRYHMPEIPTCKGIKLQSKESNSYELKAIKQKKEGKVI